MGLVVCGFDAVERGYFMEFGNGGDHVEDCNIGACFCETLGEC